MVFTSPLAAQLLGSWDLFLLLQGMPRTVAEKGSLSLFSLPFLKAGK